MIDEKDKTNEELLELIKLNNTEVVQNFLIKKNKEIDWSKIDISELAQNDSGNYILGYIYRFGIKGCKDIMKALYHYKLAAKNGDAISQKTIGFIYMNEMEETNEANKQKGIKYYKLAADQNLAAAQNNLGYRYLIGSGIKKNIEKALYYLEMATDQDCKTSAIILGGIYKGGEEGIEKDYRRAIHYFELADDYDNVWSILLSNRDTAINFLKETKELRKRTAELEARNRELEAKVKKLEMELDCIPEYGKGYFEVKKNFEDNKT